MEVVDILAFEDGPGGALRPRVPYDRIEVHVDYPLVDDPDAEESIASG